MFRVKRSRLSGMCDSSQRPIDKLTAQHSTPSTGEAQPMSCDTGEVRSCCPFIPSEVVRLTTLKCIDSYLLSNVIRHTVEYDEGSEARY